MSSQKNSKIAYCDFDGTIFDQSKFFPEFIDLLAGLSGATPEVVFDTYNDSKNPFGAYLYTEHCRKLNLTKGKLDHALGKLLHIGNYLFEDSLLFVEKLIENDYKVIILTHGEDEFQKSKITSSISDVEYEISSLMDDKSTILVKSRPGDLFIDNRVISFSYQYLCTQYRIIRDTDKYAHISTPSYVKEVFHLSEIEC